MTGAWDEIGCKLVDDEVIARVEVVDDALALVAEFAPDAVTVNGPVEVGDVALIIVDSISMFWTANE